MNMNEAIQKLIGYRRFIEKMAMTIPGYIFDAEPFDMAVEALEKQVPMKPLPQEMDIDGRAITPCGFCGEELPHNSLYDFCPHCGQRILHEKGH